MEADSTTLDSNIKNEDCYPALPFHINAGDLKLYRQLTRDNGKKFIEIQIVERLQQLGIIPKNIDCPSGLPDCKVYTKPARVVDRVQWACEGCPRRQPIRTNTILLRFQCSLLQVLQMILAWTQDADIDMASRHFGVKPKMANTIYNHMDEIAIKEQSKVKLGGENSVVLTEMYPDCLTRLSPDTTDQPHMHRVLMIADTNYIPTSYQLHVIKDDLRKNSTGSLESKTLIDEVNEVLCKVTTEGSLVVTGAHMPPVPAAATLHQLLQHCHCEMHHFLSSRIWRGAVSLCAASRDLCSGGASVACANAVQRYLSTSLYRHRTGEHLFANILSILAEQCKVSTITHRSAIIERNILRQEREVMQQSKGMQESVVTQQGAVKLQCAETQHGEVKQESELLQDSVVTQKSVETQQSELTKQGVETQQSKVTRPNVEMQQSEVMQQSEETQQSELMQQDGETQQCELMQQDVKTQQGVDTQQSEVTQENVRTHNNLVTQMSVETEQSEILQHSAVTQQTEVKQESVMTQQCDDAEDTIEDSGSVESAVGEISQEVLAYNIAP